MPPRRRIVAAVCLLAVADAVTTLVGCAQGFFEETNPILALALANGIGCFLLTKVALTSFWAGVSWSVRCPRLRLINKGVMLAYAVIVARSTLHLLLSCATSIGI